MSSLGSGSPSLLRPKLALKKWDLSSTYLTYDAFAPPSSGPALTYVSVEKAMGQTGEIDIVIEDSAKDLDSGVGQGNKFVLSISSDGVSYDNFLAGWIREYSVRRPSAGIREVRLHGYGNAIRANERLVNFFRIAKREADGVTPDLTDPAMKCSQIMTDLWTSYDAFPVAEPLEPFGTGGVDTISEALASLKMQYVEMSDVANRIADACGGLWGIDANDQVYLRYHSLAPSGITIKETADLGIDQEDRVGYFVGDWEYTDSIKKSDGFANRLFGVGGTDFHLDVDKYTVAGQEEFYSKDIAVQFIPTAPRLSAIALTLSKVGNPTDDIIGEIRLHKESTGKPDGDQVGTFNIQKDQVGTSATDVTRVNVSMTDSRLQVDKKYWIVLLKRGNSSNHFRWHHDNGTTGVNATRTSSWTVNSNHRTYAHRVYSSRRVLSEASDPKSRAKFGVIDAKIYAPYIMEWRAMDQLLTGLLQYSARQRRKYESRQILAPKKVIHPDTLVRLVHSSEGINADAEIQSVKYVFDSQDHPLGTRWVHVKPVAFVP